MGTPLLHCVPKNSLHAMVRLLLFVTSPADGACAPADVSSWLPSPATLSELDKCFLMRVGWGLSNVAALGARAYERLGRDDEATG